MKRKLSTTVLFIAATMLVRAASVGAVDGTIEINQAKVLAAGGFPYMISTANTSYRLTGSLTVSSGADGIDVTANNVTIDLNGFSITGPGGSSSAGINAAGKTDLTVENGTITGFHFGVATGNFLIVRNVHADVDGSGVDAGLNSVIEGCTANNSTDVSGSGLACGGVCVISGNTANGNARNGITCLANGCVISGNTANANATNGIQCIGSGCLISGNTVFNNATGIIASDAITGYGGNVLKNTSDHSGGTSIGNNLCSGTVC